MWEWLTIGFLGLAAGFIGTNTGGSSLVVTPLLIFLGLPPPVAIATSRVGAMGTMLASVRHFHAAGKIDMSLGFKVAALSVAGTLIGAPLIVVLPGQVLRTALGAVSLLGLAFLILRRRGLGSSSPRPWMRTAGMTCIPVISGIGSVTGGQSIVVAYVFVFLFGKTFTEAAGTRKIVGLCTATVSIIIFGAFSIVDWPRGLLLAASAAIGAHFGAQYGIRLGDRWVACAFYLVAAAAALRLLIPA